MKTLRYFNTDRLINATKTCLACAVGLLFVDLFKLPQGQWTVITILVVMSAQVHFGSTLQKGYLRFIGTLTGSAIAALCLWFFPHSNVAIKLTLLLSSLVFSYVAGKSTALGQACTLGVVTVAILLLNDNPQLSAVWLRTSEILLGIVIAVLVSLIVLPLRASRKLNKKLADNLLLLSEFLQTTISKDIEKTHIKETALMDAFAQCQKLQEETKTEPGITKTLKKSIAKIILHEKRIFRAISMLEHYLTHAELPKQLQAYYTSISRQLEQTADAIIQHKEKQLTVNMPVFPPAPAGDYFQFFLHFLAQELPQLLKEIQHYGAFRKR